MVVDAITVLKRKNGSIEPFLRYKTSMSNC